MTMAMEMENLKGDLMMTEHNFHEGYHLKKSCGLDDELALGNGMCSKRKYLEGWPELFIPLILSSNPIAGSKLIAVMGWYARLLTS